MNLFCYGERYYGESGTRAGIVAGGEFTKKPKQTVQIKSKDTRFNQGDTSKCRRDKTPRIKRTGGKAGLSKNRCGQNGKGQYICN